MYKLDEFWQLCKASMTNSDKNNDPGINMYVTIGTDEDWDADLANRTSDSSKFPVWFHKLWLFSGRAFPIHDRDSWLIVGRKWNLPTSDATYVTLMLTCICFQIKPDIPDINPLINWVRSTALKNYIRLDWNAQELQMINPAWYFNEYALLADVPSRINPGETVMLTKWLWYKWLVFAIPWAEVFINWKWWVPYCKENESLIKSQNPMDAEWRFSWDLAVEFWYEWKEVEGEIIVVDDNWNWLKHLGEKISIQVN